MSVLDFNQCAWDRLVESGSCWTVPVSSEAIAKARDGDWQVVHTLSLTGCRVPCLPSGGGQQSFILSYRILATAVANVTVFDASEKQPLSERIVAGRDGRELGTITGGMAHL